MPHHVTFGDSFYQDPSRLFRDLRPDGPIHRFTSPTGVSGWLITDYDAAREVLNSRDFGKTPATMAGSDPRQKPVGVSAHVRRWLLQRTGPWMVSHMLANEPPDHTRLRKVVQGTFSPSSLRALRPVIEGYADECIDRIRGDGPSHDLVRDYAFPIPVRVVCHILGVPDRHHRAIGECSRVMSDVIVADPAELRRAALTLARIIYPLLRSRRRTPQDDLLTTFMEAHRAKEMSLREVMSTVALLLIAGHETTANLIASTMFTVLSDPSVDTSSIQNVVEEALRFEPPLPTTTLRVAFVDSEFHGASIAAGDILMVSLAAANRDPTKYDDPDTFDPTRATRGHIGFGYGIHHCIGAPLARLEGDIALSRYLDAFPHARIADGAQPIWRPSIVFRGLESLPVRTG